MRAKHTSASVVAAALGLGLLATGCGPIAFNDTVNFKLAAPEPEPEPVTTSHAKLSGDTIVIDDMIQFEYDSAEIKSVSHGILDDVVKVMQDNPRVEQLNVVGHTSSEGSKKHNDKLSTERAESVKNYLADHGIDASRLTSEGKGPSEPIADNDTEEGRIANRRVEFKVTQMAEAPAEGEASAEVAGGARGKPGAN
ncbi:putative lipoprotein YiaD precursor [Enhygromyxa salina]|uniref:Putative lipoprotein YiaD n=1 Tax=Enhygromyxa salina TaxID=215803 RepID=A0A2S9YF32_9BACT|nr:OmpA family protein [Enhygromyxa salina]PRQ03725.1 putative lipoprotein YiaD precursor [Enhygromyxa salina]